MDISALEAIVSSANARITWALTLLAGSVVVLVNTDYHKPRGHWKKIYLTFPIAWCFLTWSLYCGDQIARMEILAKIKPENIPELADKMNDAFLAQISSLNYSVFFFALWLFSFFIWWITVDNTKQEK